MDIREETMDTSSSKEREATSDQDPDEGGSKPLFKVLDRRFWVERDEEEEGSQASQGPESKPTYVKQLEQRTDEAENRLAEYIKAYKQQVDVELVRFRERLERDAERQAEQHKMELVRELVEVLDNLDLSLQSAQKDKDLEVLLQGLIIVRQQFFTKLKAMGLAPIEAEDQPFDPKIHEAIATEPTEDPKRDGKVVEVYKAGYRLNDLLLRPALVRVSKKTG